MTQRLYEIKRFKSRLFLFFVLQWSFTALEFHSLFFRIKCACACVFIKFFINYFYYLFIYLFIAGFPGVSTVMLTVTGKETQHSVVMSNRAGQLIRIRTRHRMFISHGASWPIDTQTHKTVCVSISQLVCARACMYVCVRVS